VIQPILQRVAAPVVQALLGVALGCAGAAPVQARGPVQPPQVPVQPGGPQGILELGGEHVHSIGNVRMLITNWGLIGSHPGSTASYAGAPSAQWPSGSTTDYLFSAGLWIGAFKNGEARVTTGQYEAEFRPGRSELDHIYESREGAQGGARLPAANADDDNDGRTDEDWLDGRDNDGDGRIDEDFAAISNQMFFCEYGDGDPALELRYPEHEPLQVWVQQSSLAWEASITDDFVAFDFKIINRGFDPLDLVYIGFFADCDIGPRGRDAIAEDDYAGFWEGVEQIQVGDRSKNVKLSMGYMFDDDADDGASPGYIGLMFLGAQDPSAASSVPRQIGLRNFRMFSSNQSFSQGGDPDTDEQRYRVLDGTAPRSLGPPNPATGLRTAEVARRRGDYRMTVSAGPFERVGAGDTLGFQAALVIGPGFEGMKANAVQAQLTYDGVWLDCDGNAATGINGRETPVCGPDLAGTVVRFDGCDSTCADTPRNNTRCWGLVPDEGCVWVNADCELEETVNVPTGVEGKECLIHWLIGSAPPPPRMRLVARERQIDILWDNRSETTPDLRLDVVDFESYRIWRADNWTRPFGSDVGTGPAADLWMMLAEYDVARNGIGSDTGLEALRYDPDVPPSAVSFYREWFAVHPYQTPPVLPGMTAGQRDTAQALARGTRYYRYVDPPFVRGGARGGPCPSDGRCAPLSTPRGVVPARCNAERICQQTTPAPHSGAHYFYSVTATDHAMKPGPGGRLVATGPGIAGEPSSNFVYITPPTEALERDQWGDAGREIYVVPNPATVRSMEAWRLQPNNDDPTGTKVEFHHLPRAVGRIRIFSLAGDLIEEVPFDARDGLGTASWDLVSRNGQDVASGVYLFTVEAADAGFERFVGRFVVIR
jgi:hypothetical protein